jgi:phosphodiesterase/alkaline phosphatase D-like protein
MLPGPARTYVNMDNWDGYRDERSAIVAAIAERPTGNLVLTGDMHAFCRASSRTPTASRVPSTGSRSPSR